MRKALACILLPAIAISLFGCGKQPDENLTFREPNLLKKVVVGEGEGL